MNVPETVLTFVGAPAGIALAIAVAVLGPSELKAPAQRARYRPGRPWPHEPAWFLPRPEAVTAEALPSSSQAQISSARAAIAPAGADRTAPVGGATGEW